MVTIPTIRVFAEALAEYRRYHGYGFIPADLSTALADAWRALDDGNVVVPTTEAVADAAAALDDVVMLTARHGASDKWAYPLRSLRDVAESELASALFLAAYPPAEDPIVKALTTETEPPPPTATPGDDDEANRTNVAAQ